MGASAILFDKCVCGVTLLSGSPLTPIGNSSYPVYRWQNSGLLGLTSNVPWSDKLKPVHRFS
jgi:hypothetical protein